MFPSALCCVTEFWVSGGLRELGVFWCLAFGELGLTDFCFEWFWGECVGCLLVWVLVACGVVGILVCRFVILDFFRLRWLVILAFVVLVGIVYVCVACVVWLVCCLFYFRYVVIR